MRPMFGQIALSVLAVRENNYGQRLGAARKAGSFEGTLPRPFSLSRARRGCLCGSLCDGEAENWPCLAQAACCANSQLADSNATSVCAAAEIIREVLLCARLSALRCTPAKEGSGRRATAGRIISSRVAASRVRAFVCS